MKCLTVNTHSWLESEKQAQLKRLAQFIATEGIDIIALQEVSQTKEQTSVFPDDFFCPTPQMPVIRADNFVLLLIEELLILDQEYYWSWTFSCISHERYEEGVALLSKAPLRSREYTASKTVDPKDDRTRKILTAVTEVAGDNVIVGSCRFSQAGTEAFSFEWQTTEEYFKESEFPLLLLGDFNTPAGSEDYQRILASPLGLKDSYQSAAERSSARAVEKSDAGRKESESERFDYVFASQEWTIEKAVVVFDDYTASTISEHSGVLVTGFKK